MDRYSVIMAGGDGTRFWPLSRQNTPKYLLNISGRDIMLNETIKRLKGIIDIERTFVVTSKKQGDIVNKTVLSDLPHANILLEPFGRNTAACIAYAAMVISMRYKDGIMCVFPSDHIILNEESYRQTLLKACFVAEKTGKLVTIGINPTFPSTGYGYICRCKDKYKDLEDVYEVDNFFEKPDMEKARVFMESGNYLWNSGIFIWKASTILDNIMRYLPKLYKSIIKVKDSIGTKNEPEALEAAYGNIQGISIDYGVLERSDDVLVIPGDFGWNDIGSWDALDFICPRDENGNIIRAKHVGLSTNNSIIYGGDRLIATIGLDDFIIADTKDALLICPKDMSQKVRNLVEMITDKGLDIYT